MRLLIFCLLIFCSFFILTSCTNESKINALIDSSKECTLDSDCFLISSKCPFGCYQAINKNFKDEVTNAIDFYDSKCMYGCIECNQTKCIENICKVECDGKFY